MKISFFLQAPVLLWAAASAFGQSAPASAAFEVATIKPSVPLTPDLLMAGKAHIGTKIDKAYADFGGVPLAGLIAYAYGVKAFQVLGLDSRDTPRFDVLGKLPEGASTGAVPEMMQALLAERFHLKIHTDSKETAVYALVIGKGGSTLRPKPADYQPDYRVKSGPEPSNDLVAQTMEDYAGVLSGAVARPVVDQTGLKGEYMVPVFAALRAGMARSIELEAPRQAAMGRVFEPPPDSDLSKALIGGLKLESRKLPIKTIVVDHADMAPTAN